MPLFRIIKFVDNAVGLNKMKVFRVLTLILLSEAVHPAIKKPAYQIRMPEVQAFVTVREPL